ncbi:MAG: sigma 54-interacting transcriptional regulator [Syntrophaceae bacterium]
MKRNNYIHSSELAASEKRLEFETFLANVSARLVSLPPEQVDDAIGKALEEVLKFFAIDRISLLCLMPDKLSFRITHNSDAAGVSPYPVDSLVPVSVAPWGANMLQSMRSFSFSTLNDLPAEAFTDKRTFEAWGVQSGTYIPIAALSRFEYSLGISSSEKNRNCPKEYIPRLRLLGELFVNALERSKVEQALRESEERMGLAASAADAGLWIMEMEKGIVWATPKFRELLQFSPDEELTFERLMQNVHPDDRKRFKALVRQSLQKQEAFNLEFRAMRSDCSFRWISTRGKPFPGISDKPDRLMGASIDVTDRKQMEAELRKRLKEIEVLKLQLEKENIYLREEIRTGQGIENIVGNSEGLQYVFFKIEQVAPTDATVLILGETGTGKGLVAHAIHEMSTRRERPMITVNCAALPANLIESELFGREKGAFTGAHTKQLGRFEVAHNGTIFLDEIGELPLEVQAKLLRVLQDGEFERLGSHRTIKVDVRVITATSRDLKAEICNNRFREDLYYRLNVFPISIPPMRMRTGDIPQLVHYFIDRYSRKSGKQIKSIPKSTMKSLQDYSWPGNVRELEHIIERAVITSTGPVLHLADQFEQKISESRKEHPKELSEIERQHILKILEQTRWKINGENGAANLLNIHPSTLRFRLKKLGINRP